MSEKCRSCSADVIWCLSAPGGKRMPVDKTPDPAGHLVLDMSKDPPVATYAGTQTLKADPGRLTYRSHFATCPERDAWRKR